MSPALAEAPAREPATAVTAILLPHQQAALALFAAAARREVALSDREGVDAVLLDHDPELDPDQIDAALRLAVDLLQAGFVRLLAAGEAVLTQAERGAEQATGGEAHDALAEISDGIAAVLADLALDHPAIRATATLVPVRRVS